MDDNINNNSPTNDNVYDNTNISETGSYDNYASYADELARNEEDASLALLIEQLNHKEQKEANSLTMTLSRIEYGNASSYGQSNESSTSSNHYSVVNGSEGMLTTQTTKDAVDLPPPPSSSSLRGKLKLQGDDIFDDCFGGLGTLPEVDDPYEYYNYATLFDRIDG